MVPLFTEEKLFPQPGRVSFSTPTGKTMFKSETLATEGFNPLPEWTPPVEGPEKTPEFSAKYPLTLITGRPLMGLALPRDAAVINPADAKKYGIKDRDTIRLESKVGGGKFMMRISEEIIPGTVWISTEQYLVEKLSPPPKENQFNWQSIIDDKFNDPINGAPRANEMPVKISRIR